MSRGDDETTADTDYTRARPWLRPSGDHDDRGWRERRRSSGHDGDIGDRKGGEPREAR